MTYKAYKDKEKTKKASAAIDPSSTLANGQRTLDAPVTNGGHQDEDMDVDTSAESGAAPVTNGAAAHAATEMQE